MAQATLQHYYYIKVARDYLQKRWEEDRIRRQKSFLFRRQMKLVVADYQTFARCRLAWELCEYLQVPSITTSQSFLMGWPRLLVYFDRIVLKDIFAALLAENEDPRAHKEAFATLKERYGNSNIEYTLHEIRG
jgi:hypothetical protein